MKKFVALLLSLLLMLSLVACGQTDDGEDATAAMAPGKYTAEYRGYKDLVKVETEVDADRIVAVKVVDHKETLGMGTRAVEIMPERIVAAQSVAVDAVSGATATSMAILAAVRDALEQAGADLDQFRVEPEPPTPQDVNYDTDIVVIGGGAAGLSAGLEAARSGAEVILVEKMDIVGGNTIRSSGAFNVAGHPIQLEAGKGRLDIEEFIEFTMTGGHNLNDPELVRYMIENSAGVVDWLEEVGFKPVTGETYNAFYV
ncbi:MAG: FAD-dependent oxidoreductase, partial [bacterium]